MLTLRLPPHHKLDLHLGKKRLHPPLPKVRLRIERQAIFLVALPLEHYLQAVAAEGGGRRPGGNAAVGVGRPAEGEGGGVQRGGRVVQGEGYGDGGGGAAEGGVEDVAGYWGFLGGHGEVVGDGGEAVGCL